MCVCVCVCVCVCAHANAHVCVCACARARMCMHVCMCVFARARACVSVSVSVRPHPLCIHGTRMVSVDHRPQTVICGKWTIERSSYFRSNFEKVNQSVYIYTTHVDAIFGSAFVEM